VTPAPPSSDGFDYDLFIIGAGSGGMRAARVAAGHGARVAVAEELRVGGTCVIRGCVPKKMLFYGAHFAEDVGVARRFGWDVGTPTFDWPTLRDNVSAEVARVEGIYGDILARQKVDVFKERAVVAGPHAVRLARGRELRARHVLIATGARPVRLELPGAELAITSNEVFTLESLPRRIVIVGGGYIATEFAGMFRAFGARVTVINRDDTILRGWDAQLRGRLLELSMQKGIEFLFNVKLSSIARRPDGTLRATLADGRVLDTDVVLFAAGRVPNVAGLGLAEAGVALGDKGAVRVDADNRSSVEGLYAVGDVTDRVQLTPVAVRQGQAFADTVFGGKPTRVDYECIPRAVFSQPPLAAVGLTEAEARARLPAVRVHTSDFRPLRDVLAGRDHRALYKMVVDASTDVVVGLHMLGPDAPEILQAAAVAVKAKLTKAAFDETFALHPTMAEELVLLKP
jgi:glutathione reductase (NADPH)